MGPEVDVVEFQMPVLLGYVGRDAEAEGVDVEDVVSGNVVTVEDDIVETVADEEKEVDVELKVVDVTGFFAQSQSVNWPLMTSTNGLPPIWFCSEYVAS